MNTNKTLINSKRQKNDEFYTTTEMSREMIEPFLDQIRDLRIICPCDDENSEIYKYLKSQNLNVDYSTCMESVDYSKYDIVITNPPFSKLKEFCSCWNKQPNIKFLFIGNWIILQYSWFLKMFGKNVKWVITENRKFKNTDKLIRINFFHNLSDNKQYETPEIGKMYSYYAADWKFINRTYDLCFFHIHNKTTKKSTFIKACYGLTSQQIKDKFSDNENEVRIKINMMEENR